MRKIPTKIRKQMAEDPYMSQCCLTGESTPEWHHPWIYAGKQITDPWATMPISVLYHRLGRYSIHRGCKLTKELIEFLSLLRATPDDLKKYPKRDWQFISSRYKKKFTDKKTALEIFKKLTQTL